MSEEHEKPPTPYSQPASPAEPSPPAISDEPELEEEPGRAWWLVPAAIVGAFALKYLVRRKADPEPKTPPEKPPEAPGGQTERIIDAEFKVKDG